MLHIIRVDYEDMPCEVHSIHTPDDVKLSYVKSEIKRWNSLLYSLVDVSYMEGTNEEKLRQCFESYCEEEDIEKNLESCKKVDICNGLSEPYDIYGDEGRHMATLLEYLFKEHTDWYWDYSTYEHAYDFDENEFN